MRARSLAITLALAALVVLPALVQGTYYRFLGIVVFIYGIVAVGLNILAGYAGQLSLGHAALMAIGAYTTALLTQALAPASFFAATGLHIWLGVIAGTIAAAAFGALLAFPALRVRGPYLAMVTIAFGWVIFKVLQEWVSVTGGDLGLASIPKAQVGSYVFDTHGFYYVVLALFVAALLVQHRLVTSELGLRIRAMKHSEIAVSSVGINVHRLKVLVFVVSAAFAGFGGTLFAHQQNYISPDNFQFFSSVFFLLAVLFGGAGTLLGPVIGAAVLTLLPEMLHDFDKFRLIVYGAFILVTLYFLPNGVMGLFEIRRRQPPVADSKSAVRETPRPRIHGDCRGRARAQEYLETVRRTAGAARREPARRTRLDPRADRTERRGQDHAHQHRHRLLPCRRRGCPDRRARCPLRFDARSRRPRHCAHLSDHQAVRRHDRARARHHRPCPPFRFRARAVGAGTSSQGGRAQPRRRARADRARRIVTLREYAGQRPCLRPSPAARDRPRAGGAAASAAARRAGGGPDGRGDFVARRDHPRPARRAA